MNLYTNFKDSYVKLSQQANVLLDKSTVIESKNPVILKTLSPLLVGEKCGAAAAIRFLPFDESAKNKVTSAFGEVLEDAEDAYLLEIKPEGICVYAAGERGYLYGACTLLSHYREGIGEGYIYNLPCVPFRAVKMYLPAEDKLDEFYYMLDMFMHYGYNALVLEIGGAMEYEKHPEINEFWVNYCKEFEEYSGKTKKFQFSQYWGKNSIHIENGGGKFLSKSLVKEICAYARAHGLEPIPEVPCLSHADYLIAGRKDIAEIPDDPAPDTYCPSNPKTYELLFDVFDEVIEVFRPKVMHIGHDEYYVSCVCPRCKGKKAAKVFADDITKIHGYLKKRGIRTMLWSEKLLNAYNTAWHPAGGAYLTRLFHDTDEKVTFMGKEYTVKKLDILSHTQTAMLPPDAKFFTTEETYPAISMIPSDVIAMNWYWSYYPLGDRDYHYNGIPMVYGNFQGQLFSDWKGRVVAGAKGYAVSSWGASDFKQMQRGRRLADVVYASRMAWSKDYDDKKISTEISRTASSLFDFRFREALAGSHIDILHTTDLTIPHGYFGCGDFLDDDMFRLGYYHIFYKDGTDEKVEILWGENIGPASIKSASGESGFEDDGRPADFNYCMETIFTCDFEDKDDGRYYRFVIPTKKPVDHVKPELFSKYEDNVVISSITVKN